MFDKVTESGLMLFSGADPQAEDLGLAMFALSSVFPEGNVPWAVPGCAPAAYTAPSFARSFGRLGVSAPHPAPGVLGDDVAAEPLAVLLGAAAAFRDALSLHYVRMAGLNASRTIPFKHLLSRLRLMDGCAVFVCECGSAYPYAPAAGVLGGEDSALLCNPFCMRFDVPGGFSGDAGSLSRLLYASSEEILSALLAHICESSPAGEGSLLRSLEGELLSFAESGDASTMCVVCGRAIRVRDAASARLGRHQANCSSTCSSRLMRNREAVQEHLSRTLGYAPEDFGEPGGPLLRWGRIDYGVARF